MARLSMEKEAEIRKAAQLACGYTLWDIRDLLDEITALREEIAQLKATQVEPDTIVHSG